MKRSPQTPWWKTAAVGLGAIVVFVVLASGGIAWACNVPVFRYALEHWQSDPYQVTVFHRGPLTDEQQAMLRPLEAQTGKSPANVAVRLVDVDQFPGDAERALFAEQSEPKLPWVVAQYPQSLRNPKTVWADSLSDEAIVRLTASPLRTELTRRLVDGETAVWLMLECGDKAKDDAVAAQLEVELKKLSESLKLPDLTTAPQDDLLSDAPLQVKFSLLRAPRGAGAEQALVEMLVHSEADLVEFETPMVFPVFGRGRALLPLIGDGVTAENIRQSAGFLVGACSCEVKELNPGFDLLLTADWDMLLFHGAPPDDAIAARSTDTSDEAQLVEIPAGSSTTSAVTADVALTDPTPATIPTTPDPASTSPANQSPPSNALTFTLAALLLAAAVVLALKRFA